MTTNVRASTPFTPALGTTAQAPVQSSGQTLMDIDTTARELAGAVSRAVNSVPVAARAPGGVSTNLTSELNNIDFKKMIGGPLQAAVDAQVASSLATVDFIQKVGFKYPAGADGQPDTTKPPELVMADFTHTKKGKDKDGKDIDETVELKVPLLAMLPIPSLRIEHVIIDFNVKLNSVESASVSDKLAVDASVQGGWGPVNFKVSASYQRQTTTGVEVKKEYSLNVNVKAVQDEMPAGLEKVLGIISA